MWMEERGGCVCDSLPPFAFSDDAFDLIQSAVGARSTMFYHITPDLSCSTTLTGLGRSTFHWTECLS